MSAELIDVRLDDDGQTRLQVVVEQLQLENPELSIDDCIDVVFSIGLISTYSAMSLAEAIKGGA
jgi:hypothetical protein